MPRRNYRIYPDSTVLSAAADPRKKDRTGALFFKRARDFCTLVYSETTLRENGPDRSSMPHLARARLRLLKGKHIEKIMVGNVKIEALAWRILDKADMQDVDKASSIVRDAHHLAAAMLAKVDLLVTDNTKDFNIRLRVGAEKIGKFPTLATPETALGLVAENPPRVHPFRKKLYARQQYWSMRDYGIPSARARAYITKKWGVDPLAAL